MVKDVADTWSYIRKSSKERFLRRSFLMLSQTVINNRWSIKPQGLISISLSFYKTFEKLINLQNRQSFCHILIKRRPDYVTSLDSYFDSPNCFRLPLGCCFGSTSSQDVHIDWGALRLTFMKKCDVCKFYHYHFASLSLCILFQWN